MLGVCYFRESECRSICLKYPTIRSKYVYTTATAYALRHNWDR